MKRTEKQEKPERRVLCVIIGLSLQQVKKQKNKKKFKRGEGANKKWFPLQMRFTETTAS